MLDQEYLEAVKHFNHEVYPKISAAQSFVSLMPKAMKDIARELGEDSYSCRRLKSIGWDSVQETLMAALEELEKKERRAIPKPTFRWVKPGADAYAYINGEVLRVQITVVDEQKIICYGGSLRKNVLPFWRYEFKESDIDTILFRSEFELFQKLLPQGTPVWFVGPGTKSCVEGSVISVRPADNDCDGSVLVELPYFPRAVFQFEKINAVLFFDERRAKEKAGLV